MKRYYVGGKQDMEVTIEPTSCNEYWINFQEPENDGTPYVRIFNKNFTLENRGISSVLIPNSDSATDIMKGMYQVPFRFFYSKKDMRDEIGTVIRGFFKGVYNVAF